MHLHPYGESMELKDKTTGRTFWKGAAKSHAERAILLATDSYSSRDGIPLFKDHAYELTTVYNNPSSKPITAMAALWMYVKDKE